MNRNIIRHGFILILLALIGGFFISAMELPRLGLSAHTIGLLGGVLLIGIGAVWTQFSLPAWASTTLYWSWLYSSYVNWLGCLIGAIYGAGKTTPVVSAGAVGPDVAETAVAIMLVSVGLVSLIAVGLSIWGLRLPKASTVPQDATV